MTDDKLTRRKLLAGAGAIVGVASLGVLGKAAAQDATPSPNATPAIETTPNPGTPAASPVAQQPAVSDWPFYGNTIEGTAFTSSAGINASNVANLKLAWSAPVDGSISATPVIAQGMAVIGSHDGKLRAFDPLSGQALWTYDTGAQVMDPKLNIPLGIIGSAAIANNVVYVGDAAGKLHAIDAATGKAIWMVSPNEQKAASISSSPIVNGGSIYLGITSVSQVTTFRGAVVAVNASDGKTLWEHYPMPKGRTGGNVIGVPAVDAKRGLVFAGTMQSLSTRTSGLGNVTSVLALDATTGDLKWAFAGTHDGGKFGPADDVGFSASPNLFSAKVNGNDVDLVGIGQKNGIYHALDRDTGDIVWEQTIASAGPLGGMAGTSAVGNGVIVIPATEWADLTSTDAKGRVQALDVATGSVLWTNEQKAPDPAPVAIANDVAFQAGFEGVLRGLGLSDGKEHFSYDLGASVSGGIAVAGDLVMLGSGTPKFSSIVKEGSKIWAFALDRTAPSGTPVASPVSTPVAPTETPTLTPTEAASPVATPVP